MPIVLTPPNSPVNIVNDPDNQPDESWQKISGRTRSARCRAKLGHEVDKLQRKLEQTERESSMYKKRWQRYVGTANSDSPRSKTMRLLRHATNNTIRKTLLFHHTIIQNIKTKYVHTREEREKQVSSRLFTSDIMKRYKIQNFAQKELGFSRRRFKRGLERTGFNGKKYMSLSHKLRKEVEEYYCRDDVSRNTSGKKQTVTKDKKKMQKRLLNDTMDNLHEKYLSENSKTKISYSLFCKMRPFWVVPPPDKDRETCLYKMHENLQYLATTLKELKLLKNNNLDNLVKRVIFMKSPACMGNVKHVKRPM